MLNEADWEEKHNQTQPEKTNWVPWVVGGGILVFIIALVAIVGLTRKND
jgi:hypothetical protein